MSAIQDHPAWSVVSERYHCAYFDLGNIQPSAWQEALLFTAVRRRPGTAQLAKMCQGYLPENSLLGNIDTVATHETGITGMMLYLDCEFTQLSPAAKLISLAFVANDGREFYIELLNSWSIEDCSDLVIDIVLPQLWGGAYATPVLAARDTILAFLEGFTEMVEIVTDAPHFDWELLYQLTYSHGHWPSNVRNWPTDATTLDAVNDGSPLPHHALLDARIIASMSGQRMYRLYRR